MSISVGSITAELTKSNRLSRDRSTTLLRLNESIEQGLRSVILICSNVLPAKVVGPVFDQCAVAGLWAAESIDDCRLMNVDFRSESGESRRQPK
jgi:hypothetical protein